MISYKKLLQITLLLIFFNGCSQGPGINNNPKSQNESKKISEFYTLKDVEIEIIKINDLDENELKEFNVSKIDELSFSTKNFSNIYNYEYKYVLDASDVISINLTDIEDIDGSYTIDPNGDIDLPFIGKVRIINLDINQAQNALMSVLKKYYKNPDIQISIIEFNSSKAYIIGAVENQLTIDLDQKPIRLIDAAIQAAYTPNASTKSFGSKGFLRRDNKIYKIDINNIFKNQDSKENFYIKKNDVIYVDRNSDSIHVFGEVTKPGVYFPNMDYSLTELISTAGLNSLTANASKIYIIREKYDKFLKVNVFQLDLKNPINLILGKRFQLHSKDIVFIPPAGIVKWNRIISLLIPQTDLFKSYNPIIQDGFKSGSNNTTE